MYGALLIEALQRLAGERAGPTPNQKLEFFGIGGDRMGAAGCDIVVDSKELAVVGISEILGHLPKIWSLFHKLIAEAAKRTPGLAIVIDSPAFNWRVARQMRKRGVPVVYSGMDPRHPRNCDHDEPVLSRCTGGELFDIWAECPDHSRRPRRCGIPDLAQRVPQFDCAGHAELHRCCRDDHRLVEPRRWLDDHDCGGDGCRDGLRCYRARNPANPDDYDGRNDLRHKFRVGYVVRLPGRI